MIEWIIQEWKLSDLKENPKNPRRMSTEMAEGLRKSIEKFGECSPIQINTDGEIIGGHQRFKVLKKMGCKTTAVMVPKETLSEEQVNELCIRLNKNIGYFDDDMLANAWDIDLLLDCGFTLEELHMGEEPKEEEEEKPTVIMISLKDSEQANMLERHLTTVLCEYPGSKLKVKNK